MAIAGKPFGQKLDGDLAPELCVSRTPHFSHSTLTEECADLVVAEFGAGFHSSCVYGSEPCKTPSVLDLLKQRERPLERVLHRSEVPFVTGELV